VSELSPLCDQHQVLTARQETEELQKKQATYHNNKEHFTKDEHDAYIQYCNEAILRISVLETRLGSVRFFVFLTSQLAHSFSQHRDSSHKKFRDEFERLIADPRMSALRYGR
jgi:hypothetical protein